mgnify:CR=1 FL=1
MTDGGFHHHVTAVLPVHALDKVYFFQFLQRAIDGDQPDAWLNFAAEVKEFNGIKGSRAVGKQFHDHAPRGGDAASILLQ